MKTTLQKQSIVSLLTFILSLFVLISNSQTVQTFTTSGSWVCPYGVTSIAVETWGGGGAGGAAPTNPSVGGGGGGGAYRITTSVPVTYGTTYNYIVGAGGLGNTTGSGANGISSSFNGLYTANAGLGGGSGNPIGSGGNGATGGNFNGGNGVNGILTQSGGGGGGAGSTGNGGNAVGATAGTPGSGGGGAGGAGVTKNTTGNNGNTIGGGGSGAFSNAIVAKKGGDGANGQVRLTYTINCTAPPAQPNGIILSSSTNNIMGMFIKAAFTDGYIVIRTATSAAPTSPVNGTNYTAGSSALGGYIESVGTLTTFNSISLSGTTQYWYWVYGYNNVSCVGGITYLTTFPLTGSSKTLACGVILNKAVITTPGTTTYNFSTLSWSLGHVPTSCENAEIIVNISTATAADVTTVVWDIDFTCINMTLTNTSSDAYVHIFQTNGTSTINMLGDLFMRSPGANRFNRSVFSNQTLTTINGNLILGNPIQGSLDGHAAIGSNGTTPDQTYILKGNMTFNPRGYTTDEWTKFIFDKAGTQIITNNTVISDTIQPVLFEKLIIGSTNATTVILAGTTPDCYIENVRAAGVTIGVNSTLDLPANYSFTKFAGGFAEPLTMLAGAKLRLGGDKTIDVSGAVSSVIIGSNFPTNFSPYTFDTTSTVEYYGSNNLIQTIYNGVTYANLVATNGSGSGRAVKQTTAGALSINTSFNINGLADVYLGTSTGIGTNTSPVSSTGPLSILATGGFYCNANVVSGTGAFAMGNGSYLGMGHVQGISNSGSATGNIQMTGGRFYNTTGNYIYNGILNQVTGGGLPTIVNDLTTDNPTSVTISTNQLVNGVDSLKQGTFDIGSTKITHNGTGTLNSISGKMKANFGIVEMKGTSGTAQNISGSWFVNKTISSLINANTKGITVAASPADTLLIASALVYGAVTNSAISTNDNLTLLSRDTATASFGTITTGSSIAGKVTIERYLPAKKSWRLLAAPIVNATSPTVTAAWREGGASLAGNGYGTRITGPAGYTGVDEYTQRASMKYYDPATNNYINVTNTNTTLISNTQGFYVFVRGDRSVPVTGAAAPTILRIKGDVVTGTQVVPVAAGKFVTFGNPYPATLNLKTAVKSNISNTYYAWNPNSAGSYNVGAFENYTFNGTDYVKVPGGAIRNTIQSGEAIFIQSSGGAGTLTINESDKTGGVTTPVSRGATTSAREGVVRPTLEVNMYTKNIDSSIYLTDGILMNFNDDYSSSVDNDDVRKILNAGDNIFLKNGDANLIVERRPNLKISDTIKLNLTNTRINFYRFEFDPLALDNIGLEATLKDKFTGSETAVSLLRLTGYNFNITADVASKVNDRFMIVFKQVPAMLFIKIAAVREKNNSAKLTWYTENENNINSYKIEHSIDGINFIETGNQTPTANNNGTPYYNFIHTTLVDGNNWYRVKAITMTGTQQYSEIAKIDAKEMEVPPAISVFPNPVVDRILNINFSNVSAGKYQLTINNMVGQIFYSKTLHIQTNNLRKTINLGNVAVGNYQLIVKNEKGKSNKISFIVK